MQVSWLSSKGFLALRLSVGVASWSEMHVVVTDLAPFLLGQLTRPSSPKLKKDLLVTQLEGEKVNLLPLADTSRCSKNCETPFFRTSNSSFDGNERRTLSGQAFAD